MKNETMHSIGILGGVVSFLVGGFDQLFYSLLVMMVADWVTGVLKALKNGKFSPLHGLWGIVNKIVCVIVVISVNFIQLSMKTQLPLREVVVTMLTINEFLSLLKNSSTFVKGLKPLTKYFESVRINILKVFTIDE